jgi:hypothetical protein
MLQTNSDFKKATELKVKDANFSPVTIFFYFACSFGQLADFILMIQDEHRAIHPKYSYAHISEGSDAIVEDLRGKKRARAKDFL